MRRIALLPVASIGLCTHFRAGREGWRGCAAADGCSQREQAAAG